MYIYCRELERRQKTEDARRDTDAILAQQAEEVRLRKVRMEAQDVERAKRLDAEAKEAARRNGEKRQKAQLRISSESPKGATRVHDSKLFEGFFLGDRIVGGLCQAAHTGGFCLFSCLKVA